MPGSGKTPEQYQIEDFVTDESFINYSFHRNTDDEAFWDQWLSTHPYQKESVDAAKEILRSLSLTLPDQEYKKEFSRIRKTINSTSSTVYTPLQWGSTPIPAAEKGIKYSRHLLPALLIIITAGTFFMREFVLQAQQLIEKYNNSGKPEVLTLSDGTVITLAPQARIFYPSDFGNQDRKVKLDGEAQFNVNRDEKHPFKVYAGELVATVLGTVFNVNSMAVDSGVVIELIKGSLKVETKSDPGLPPGSVLLNPGERVVYKHKNRLLYKEKWQSQNGTQLQLNHVIFHQNNFEEIAQQLKSIFGVTLVNLSDKKNWRFTGEFKNTSALNILESICIVEKLQYEVQGDTVFIK
jgi:transmembrane sensor